MNNIKNQPESYLSTSNGFWRVVWKGIPLNADTKDRSRAEEVAKKYKINLPSIIFADGEWVSDRNNQERNT